MKEYLIQFKPKDVQKVITNWMEESKKSEEAITWINAIVSHTFLSPFYGIRDISSLAITPEEENKELRDRYFVEDIFARAYIQNLHNLGKNYVNSMVEIFKEVTSQKENISKKKFRRISR